MRTVIVHYHLFKNAGSSLDASFKDWLGIDQWATKEFPGHLNQNRNQLRQWIIDSPDVVCFSSHSAHFPPPEIEGVRVLPVIFIRNPLDRILSAYEFEKKQGADTLGSVIARNTTLSGYLEIFLSQHGWNQVSNFHCHRFAHYFDSSGKALVERAELAVEELPFIGVVEDYSGSLIRLEKYLENNGFEGVSLKAKSVNINSKRSKTLTMRLDELRNSIDPRVYNKLIESNQGDFALYKKVTGNEAEVASEKKYLIQYWAGSDDPKIISLMDEWRSINVEYQYVRFDEESALEFILKHYGETKAKAFSGINFQAMKSDVFRLAAVNILGGVYIDAATKCSRPISDWGIDSCIPTFIKKRNGQIANALISSSASNKLIGKMLEEAWLAIVKKSEGNIWLQTGPGMLNKVINEAQLPYELIEQENEDNYFKFQHDFEHKRSAHWSKQQLLRPLFTHSINQAICQKIETYKDVFSDIELDLHIGQHKTGTTSIQKALFEMQSEEVLYPRTGLVGVGHHSWSDIFANRNVIKIIGLIGSLKTEIQTRNITRIIISSEYFSSGNEITFDKKRMVNIWQFLSAFSNCFKRSNLVFYTREQASSIDSRIKQAIESRICLQRVNWKSVANNPSLSYSSFLEAMSYYFPNSKLEPRSFENAIKKGGVVNDFSSRFGGNLKSNNSNVSYPSIDIYQQMLEVNKLDISIEEKMKKKQELRVSNQKVKTASSKSSVLNMFKQSKKAAGQDKQSIIMEQDIKEIEKLFMSENHHFKPKVIN